MMRSVFIVLALVPIYIYRYGVSPFLGPRCRYLPTCSDYATEAVRRHGAWRGGWLTMRRLARCHPVRWAGGGSGYDPVPPILPLEVSPKATIKGAQENDDDNTHTP